MCSKLPYPTLPYTAIAVGNETSATRTAAHTEEAYLWNEFPDALLFDLVDQVCFWRRWKGEKGKQRLSYRPALYTHKRTKLSRSANPPLRSR